MKEKQNRIVLFDPLEQPWTVVTAFMNRLVVQLPQSSPYCWLSTREALVDLNPQPHSLSLSCFSAAAVKWSRRIWVDAFSTRLYCQPLHLKLNEHFWFLSQQRSTEVYENALRWLEMAGDCNVRMRLKELGSPHTCFTALHFIFTQCNTLNSFSLTKQENIKKNNWIAKTEYFFFFFSC